MCAIKIYMSYYAWNNFSLMIITIIILYNHKSIICNDYILGKVKVKHWTKQ